MEAYTREAACQDRTAKAGFQKQKKTKENREKPGKTGENESTKYVALLAPGLGEGCVVSGEWRIVNKLGRAEEGTKQVVLRKKRPTFFHKRPTFFHKRPIFFHRRPTEKRPRAWDILERPAERKTVMPEIKGSTLSSTHHSPHTPHQAPVQVVQHETAIKK